MWYYSVNDTQYGPADPNEVAQLIANGTINAQTFVWTEGMGEWQAAGQTALASSFAASPALGGALRSPGALGGAGALGGYGATAQALPWQSGGSSSSGSWKSILFGFQGRIPRRLYWAGIGIWIGIIFVLGFIIGLIANATENPNLLGLMAVVYIPYLWSLIALQVKRWHDRGKSGWFVLVNLIPFVGGIWALVECGCLRGTQGPNLYGQDPT